MKILWVDLLCFKTLFIACIRQKKEFDRIHFINVHKTFSPFINIISKIINKPIISLNDIVESEKFINNSNLYEVIQNHIYVILDQWLQSKYTKNKVKIFIDKTGFSESKYNAHLKERAYFFAFKQIEIHSIAKVIGEDSYNLFLLKSTPLNNEIRTMFEPQIIDFYSYSGHSIHERRTHIFDWQINRNYYKSISLPSIKLIIDWFFISFSSLFRSQADNKINNSGLSSIGVELVQPKSIKNSINDSYWLKNSEINLSSVIGLTTIDYDQKSLNNFNKIGIKLINVSGNIFKFAKNRMLNRKKIYQPKYIFTDVNFFLLTFSRAILTINSILFNNRSSWFNYQESFYFIRSYFWKSIYNQFDIRLLWTMYDFDPDKLVKAQALELCNGLYLGSHWSNYAMAQVDIEKCYDIFFVWSNYFVSKDFFSHYPYKAVFQVGFPSDHNFDSVRKESQKLEYEYRNNFVISYFDNVLRNDLPFSENMQMDIYHMLIGLLKNYKKLVVFFKPKRRTEFMNYLTKFKALDEFHNSGRIRVFYGTSERTKASPALVSMASDLVLGIGISSAAAEGCFSGSVSFHANFSKMNNSFDKNGLDKVVFRDINTLEQAIINQINNKGISFQESQEYHKILDPFQDGLAYKRTGLIISNLQKELSSSKDIDKVVKKTQEKFIKLSC